MIRHDRFIDMTGKRIGCLTVVSEAPRDGNKTRWHCVCDCGNKVIRVAYGLRWAAKSGIESSCGSCRPGHGGRTPGAPRVRRRQPSRYNGAGKYCEHCFGLPHRRPRSGPCRCGERYASEPPPAPIDPFRSMSDWRLPS